MYDNINLNDFVSAAYPDLVENEVICIAKQTENGFAHYPATTRKLKQIEKKPDAYYLCISTVIAADPLRRRKHDCQCACVIYLDDIGTKATAPPVSPSAIMETSAGNYQYLYFIDPYELNTDDDIRYFEGCHRALIEAGYCDPGSQGVNRVYRMPGSINKKEGRNNFATKITFWQPDRVWSLKELMAELRLKPVLKTVTGEDYGATVPEGFSDPVLDWLEEQGHLGECRDDFFDIRCPWADQHTTGKDTAGYSPLGYGRPSVLRGFHCFHAHCQDRTASDFLAWVQHQGGPGVSISGVTELEADVLRRETRALTHTERITVLYSSFPKIWKKNLPHLTRTAAGVPGGAQKVTRPNVQHVVDAIGVHARMNMQSHKTEFMFRDAALNELVNHPDEILRCTLDSAQLAGMASADDFMKVAAEIGLNDAYHPMQDWIKSKPWDKTSRFESLLNAVTVGADYGEIWPVYLRRWLLQCVQAVMGWQDPQQMRGCLVLAGDQNIGKSRFFASLVPPDYFLEGAHIELHGTAAKDSIMQTTAYPIVELGELETTFSKSATGQLKAFLALKKDTYRAPYDIRARDWPRCTSFCGTVNKQDFLVDETGSTRFWPVWVDAVNPDHGIDIQQLWAEVYEWWAAGEKWWLTPEEDAMRAAQADQFETVSEVKEQAVDWLLSHKWPGTPMTVTNFARAIEVQASKQNLSLLRGILIDLLGAPKRQLQGVQNAWDVPTTQGVNVKINGKINPVN